MSYVKLPNDRFLRMFTDDQVKRLHLASLQVLEQVGISTDSEMIMKIFSDGGADVDKARKLVKIPERLVTDALKRVPRGVKLYGRDTRHDIILERGRVHFGYGGTPLSRILDLETGNSRPSTKKDVADATRVGDALSNIAYIMSICGALDGPPETHYLHELQAVFPNTEKHVVWALPGAPIAKAALAMAACVVGGYQELKKKPILSCYSESISPLTLSSMNEDMIEFAKAGIPVFFTGGPTLGLTAPATISGGYVVANAETLAALTACQLINPGTPFVYGPGVVVPDLRNLRVSFGAPEWGMGHILQSQLANLYELPTFGWAGPSDSKRVDSQAGVEFALSALMSALCGTTMIHCFGDLAGSEYGSMEMGVICDEIACMIFRILKGAGVDEEDLAVELIRQVGPGGNFLAHAHTISQLTSNVFVPQLFDKDSEASWRKRGAKDTYELAKENVSKILKEHHPQPLPHDVIDELAKIVKKADREVTGANTNIAKDAS